MSERLRQILERIDATGMPRRTLMERAGLSYDALLSWQQGARAPRASSMEKLEVALRALGGEMGSVADDVAEFVRAARRGGGT